MPFRRPRADRPPKTSGDRRVRILFSVVRGFVPRPDYRAFLRAPPCVGQQRLTADVSACHAVAETYGGVRCCRV